MSYIAIQDVGKQHVDRVNKILSGIKGGAIKAQYSALKRAGDTAKTRAGQFASAEYTISKSDFMSKTKQKVKVTNGIGGTRMELTFAGNVIPLLEFNTKYARDGHVQTQVKRNGGNSTLQHAFVESIFGRLGVFERVGDSRFPVEGKYGPSTAHMMENENVTFQMSEIVQKTYDERIEHEILRVLNGWGGQS